MGRDLRSTTVVKPGWLAHTDAVMRNTFQARGASTSVPIRRRVHSFDDFDRVYLPWSVSAANERVSAFSRTQLGELSVCQADCDVFSADRGPRHISATQGRWLVASVTHEGRTAYRHREWETEVSSGWLYLWDSDAPAQFSVLEPSRKTSLLIPWVRVSRLYPELLALVGRGVALEPSSLAPLFGLVDAIESVEMMPASLVSSVERSILDFLAIAIRSATRDSLSVAEARFERACEYIRSHLRDRSLSATDVARHLHVSLRTLQLAFAENGTSVADYVRTSRLEGARQELLTDTGRTITQVAYDWGFNDSSHFSRAFRSQFGVSPRDIRSTLGAADLAG